MNPAHDSSTLQAALKRTHAELNNAILKLTAHDQLMRQQITYARMSFFVIAAQALYNDLIAHAIRVLDEHRDATSFWYIVKCSESVARRAAQDSHLDLEALKTLSSKLRHVREKTHFHIDKKSIKDSRSVWKDADIKGSDLAHALRAMAATAARIKMELFGGDLDEVTEYDGSDIEKIVKAFEAVHGSVHGA